VRAGFFRCPLVLLITKCVTNRIPILIELPMYTGGTPVILLIIAYTPATVPFLRASKAAALRFLV